ncbi:MAG TPA: flagellar basal-body rod protein FlgF [Tepidisphaeraceae bacterium]|nr:flagellar basal-body rod protein FlgF [Tepidisphaeraceae bacterium]
MIYGLYISATGIAANSYKQDVIANNLANSETAGFKRDVAAFKQRLTAAQEGRAVGSWSDSILEGLGGGMFAMPNQIDLAPGSLQETGSPLDVAISGDGFFAVRENGKTLLTRDGRFTVNRDGQLVLSSGQPVLDSAGQPIAIAPDAPVAIDAEGEISQNGQPVAQLGLVDPADKSTLTKAGGNLLDPGDSPLRPIETRVRSQFVEQSNVDPATEMADLMNTQRQLEANANMIQMQDQTLQRLVNDVGKID